ncbi:hypothetical protein H1R20_g15345, partial [Candolleomyces eurysporus]
MVNGRNVITNGQFTDRVADLCLGMANKPLIGWHRHDGDNQKFNIESVHGSETEVKMSLKTNGHTAYVTSVSPSPGSALIGADASVASVYTIHKEDSGLFKISIKAADGSVLYWTLTDGNEATIISLQPASNEGKQTWGLGSA